MEYEENLQPREKLLAYGAVALTDVELLAIFYEQVGKGNQ